MNIKGIPRPPSEGLVKITGLSTNPFVDFASDDGDFADHLGIHLDGGSVTGAIIIEGDTGAKLILGDSGGGVNDKIFEWEVDGGVLTGRSLNDDLTALVDNAIVVDLGTGAIKVLSLEILSTLGTIIPDVTTFAFTRTGDSDTGLEFLVSANAKYNFKRDGDIKASINASTEDWSFLALKNQALQIQDNSYAFVLASDTDTGVFFNNAALLLEFRVGGVSTHVFNISNGDFQCNGNITIGSGAAGVDYTLTFDGENSDGVITWLEDEDRFRIHDDVDMNAKFITNLSGLHFNSASELTISAGAVTATQGHHRIDTESDATNDDLDTINGVNSGEILLILPANNNRTVRLRNGVGNIYLKHQVENKSFSFASPVGSSGTFYTGGYYNWSATDANLTGGSPSVTHGASNSASACHIGIVAGGAGSVDTGVVKLTVSGTTMDDNGVRAASQTVDLVADITALSTDQYVETVEKWIGQVTISLATVSGSPTVVALDINYGCSKYEDFGNQAFTINTLECVGRAGANDTGFNLRLFHHSSSNWTYAASGFVPGGTVLANMNTDYGTEKDLVNGESVAYKRVDLNTDIAGSNAEGLVLEVTTGANKSVETMDVHFGVHTAPSFSYMASTKQHLIFMEHGGNLLEL